MATATGPTEHPLIRSLLSEGHRFNIYQALSLIERSYPDSAPLGQTGPASREIVRIRPDVDLGFPPGSVASIEWLDETPEETGFAIAPTREGRFRITATFLGLYGIDSPLPNHWSEEILHEQSTDTTVRDFLDIFHHRVYSLLFRIWTKYRYPVQYRITGDDAFSRRFLALIGLELPPGPAEGRPGRSVEDLSERESGGLPAMRFLRYAGLLIQRPRSAAGLEAFLCDWFGGVPIEIEPCSGRWVVVSPAERTRLGGSGCTLGQDALLGEKVYDRSGQFRMDLGPLDYHQYRDFLPNGAAHGTLRTLVRFFVTDRLDAELELELSGEQVPPLRLDSDEPPRLGWTTWLTSERPPNDVSAVFAMREYS